MDYLAALTLLNETLDADSDPMNAAYFLFQAHETVKSALILAISKDHRYVPLVPTQEMDNAWHAALPCPFHIAYRHMIDTVDVALSGDSADHAVQDEKDRQQRLDNRSNVYPYCNQDLNS